MKPFVDANVLVTVLCNEYPRFSACARVLSLADHSSFKVFTSPLCLAIGYYFSEKKNGTKKAKTNISALAQKLKTAAIDRQAVEQAVNNKSLPDFEDAMQYYAAVNAGCDCIITYDRKDYWFSELEVLLPEEYLMKYVVRKK